MLANSMSLYFSFFGILDNFIDLRMGAQEAISKWHGIGTWLRSLLQTFTKMIYADLYHPALFDPA